MRKACLTCAGLVFGLQLALCVPLERGAARPDPEPASQEMVDGFLSQFLSSSSLSAGPATKSDGGSNERLTKTYRDDHDDEHRGYGDPHLDKYVDHEDNDKLHHDHHGWKKNKYDDGYEKGKLVSMPSLPRSLSRIFQKRRATTVPHWTADSTSTLTLSIPRSALKSSSKTINPISLTITR